MKSEVEPFFIINVCGELIFHAFFKEGKKLYGIVWYCICIFYVSVFMKTSNLQNLCTASKTPPQNSWCNTIYVNRNTWQAQMMWQHSILECSVFKNWLSLHIWLWKPLKCVEFPPLKSPSWCVFAGVYLSWHYPEPGNVVRRQKEQLGGSPGWQHQSKNPGPESQGETAFLWAVKSHFPEFLLLHKTLHVSGADLWKCTGKQLEIFKIWNSPAVKTNGYHQPIPWNVNIASFLPQFYQLKDI